MRVADYIANFLYDHGIRNVFLLSGTGSIYLDDAFAFHSDMNFIAARHEAAAVGMAEGAAKITDDLGVVVTTTGPGSTNAFPGIVEAWVDSVPIMVISGQVERKHLSQELRSFGVQGFDIISQVGNVTKYAVQVTEPQTIRYHMEKAVHAALTGRKGPVILDIPFDVQAAEIVLKDLHGFTPETTNTTPTLDSPSLGQALQTMLEAKRPLVVVGQGVRQGGAIDAFIEFIERIKVPVISSRLGQDILPDSHDLYFNQAGMIGHRHTFAMTSECDVVVSLGSSLAAAFVGPDAEYFTDNTQFIAVNIDATEFEKSGLTIHHPIISDVQAVLAYWNKALEKIALPNWSGWLARCRAHKTKTPVILEENRTDPINSYCFVERLDLASGPDDVFISDAGGTYYSTGQVLKFNKGQREVTSGTFASMGMTLPLAIGVAASRPVGRVLALTGDGSIELNIQELRTISQHNLNIKVFIINNGGYASIRASQDAMCGGRYTDEQKVLNFQKVAEAFELEFYLLEHYATLDQDIRRIIGASGPALIEVVCDNEQHMHKFQDEVMTP